IGWELQQRPELSGPPRSDKADSGLLQRDTGQLRGLFPARGDRKGARERSSGHDFARRERRTERIFRERPGEMAQCKQRPVKDVGGGPVIDMGPVAEKVDLE